jgi:hypothetical protein
MSGARQCQKRKKPALTLWRSGQRRPFSHTMNGCGIQAQQALPDGKAMMA